MAKEESPETMAKTTFVITMVGAALFIGIVFTFILLQN
jgi:hypothetical protein